MLKFTCPHCQVVFQAEETLVGKTVRCGKCKQLVQIPSIPVESVLPSDAKPPPRPLPQQRQPSETSPFQIDTSGKRSRKQSGRTSGSFNVSYAIASGLHAIPSSNYEGRVHIDSTSVRCEGNKIGKLFSNIGMLFGGGVGGFFIGGLDSIRASAKPPTHEIRLDLAGRSAYMRDVEKNGEIRIAEFRFPLDEGKFLCVQVVSVPQSDDVGEVIDLLRNHLGERFHEQMPPDSAQERRTAVARKVLRIIVIANLVILAIFTLLVVIAVNVAPS